MSGTMTSQSVCQGIGVDLAPVLHLLDIAVVGVRQPLGLRLVGKLEIAEDVADGAGAELGEGGLRLIGLDEVEQELGEIALGGVVSVDHQCGGGVDGGARDDHRRVDPLLGQHRLEGEGVKSYLIMAGTSPFSSSWAFPSLGLNCGSSF